MGRFRGLNFASPGSARRSWSMAEMAASSFLTSVLKRERLRRLRALRLRDCLMCFWADA